ncbi:FhaA domain-containing protein [Zhihengliuella halotolerans]|uniref:Type III secretion system (T3SS) inner membrane Yop/YscD-like protein n=1 Tax=Zhihengliuella halotolerans TaxID=370736 RepID=A0A4Q8AFR4_9MICC|nr:DUF3662 and FHA domain-containing protein [Zhihengliuella halotolerans]RZU63187.1 type III secretion system (T3SS) inner membrane Yop/YscD-like protein [Zhihengliuella halotolerans]
MGLVDNVERGLEKLVTSVFRGSSGGGIQPVEIASKLRNQMDRGTLTVAQGRTTAPNKFTVALAPADYDKVEKYGTALAEELCDVVIAHAKSQHYTLTGRVEVVFEQDADAREGNLTVDARIARDSAAPRAPRPSTTTEAPAPSPGSPPATVAAPKLQPVLQMNGKRYGLNSESIILGRSSEADVEVDDTGVSRKHLEIRSEHGKVWAVDLGSTNGSYVNGQKVDGRAELFDGSIISMGRTRITFRMLPQRTGGQQ